MSYERFRASMSDAALIAVAEHWNDARSGRMMPGWRDIDPAAIKEHLQIVWAWRWDAEIGTFIGRLAGEGIIATLGKNTRGKRMDEVLHPDAREVVLARCKRVIGDPAIMRSHGKVYVTTGRDGWGERIVLPLAADGRNGDGVLGATVYRFDTRPQTSDKISVDYQGEVTEFFPLS